VTQLTGDVDLFVGDPTIPQPTYNNFTWSSATTGSAEVVEVPGPSVVCGGNASCPIYVAVAPYVPGLSTYSIVAMNISGPVMLTDGNPVDGSLLMNDVDHYNFTLTPSSTFAYLTLALTSWYGDADVYLTINDGSGQWPGPSNYQYKAVGNGGSDAVTVQFTDPVFASRCAVAGPTPCVISISVVAYTDCIYTLTATTSVGVTQLVSGLPVTGYVGQGRYAYFNFTAPTADNFTIFVTALNGDPDVYVSATVARPTTGSYTWSAATGADEVIPIGTNDPNYLPPPNYYMIGVFGWAGNNTFTVLVRMDNAANGTARLVDGTPQAGYALAHTFAYFSFNMSTQYPLGKPFPGLDVAVIPQTGDVDLYISNITTIGANGLPALVYPRVICTYYLASGRCGVYSVDKTTYTWSSTQSGVQDFVSLPPSILYPGEGFIIGVLATTLDRPNGLLPDPSVFSVVAATGTNTMLLPSGVSVPGAVQANQYKYYRYPVTLWGMDIIVSAQIKSGGSLDIFVGESYVPSNGNSTWNTTSGQGILKDKFVVVPWTALSASCQDSMWSGTTCYLYIAVQGYKNMGPGAESIYSIIAEVSGSPTYPYYINNGQAIFSYIPANLYEYFYGRISISPDQTIYITVENVVGSTTLYANIGTNKNFWVAGQGTTPDITSQNVGGFERLVIAPGVNAAPGGPTTERERRAGRLSAVVHLTADETTGLVTVTSEDTDGVLAANAGARVVHTLGRGAAVIAIPLREVAEEEEELEVDAAAARLTLPPRPRAYRVPGNGRPVRPYTSAAARLSPDNKFATGEIVEVLARAREAESVARSRGDVDMAPQPSAQDLQAEAARGPSLDSPFYCNECELYLTVAAGAAPAQVLVSYFGGSTYQPLNNGVPLPGISPAGSAGFYAFTASDPLVDITISIAQTFGQVDVFVLVQEPSTPQSMPNQNLFTWTFSPWNGMTSLVINHTDPGFCVPIDNSAPGTPCTFLIGVYARNNETATYIVSASADPAGLVPLFDGQPTQGQVAEGALNYYVYQASSPGYAVPAVILAWTNLLGGVVAYVTNQYVPGVSAAALLPGPTSTACQWLGTNYSGLYMAPGDQCYNPNLPVYTIAIMGNTGFPGAVSRYELSASVQGDPTALVYGVPTANVS
jgi:hypothetical protein